MSNFVTRAGSRVRNFFTSISIAFYAKLVPEFVTGLFGYAVGALGRSVAANNQRLSAEIEFRTSLQASRDASVKRTVAAYDDRDRALRIKQRLEDFLT